MAAPESRLSAEELTRVRSLQILPGLIRARLAVAWARAGVDPVHLDQALEACVEHCRRQRVRPEQLRDALQALLQPHGDEPELDPQREQARGAMIAAATRRLAAVSS